MKEWGELKEGGKEGVTLQKIALAFPRKYRFSRKYHVKIRIKCL